MPGKENDALLPIQVEKTQTSQGQNEYVVTFGHDGKFGKVVANAPSGEAKKIEIQSTERGVLLEDTIPSDDLIFEAEQNIRAFKGCYEQRAQVSIAILKREK